MVQRFEMAACALVSRRYGIAVSSGTSGLHVAVRALGVRPGDPVLTTAFSFVASINCFLYEGAVPVLADIDPMTYNLDPASVEEVLTSRVGQPPTVLLPVHAFGQPADMTQLMKLAAGSGMRVLEDACEALGAEHAGRPTGSFGDLGVFAFYPNKQITTGEGGLIVTDDERLAAIGRSLRNQGRGEGSDWFDHIRLGYNYRLDELSAACTRRHSDPSTQSRHPLSLQRRRGCLGSFT
jgi:perosamine synthetase